MDTKVTKPSPQVVGEFHRTSALQSLTVLCFKSNNSVDEVAGLVRKEKTLYGDGKIINLMRMPKLKLNLQHQLNQCGLICNAPNILSMNLLKYFFVIVVFLGCSSHVFGKSAQAKVEHSSISLGQITKCGVIAGSCVAQLIAWMSSTRAAMDAAHQVSCSYRIGDVKTSGTLTDPIETWARHYSYDIILGCSSAITGVYSESTTPDMILVSAEAHCPDRVSQVVATPESTANHLKVYCPLLMARSENKDPHFFSCPAVEKPVYGETGVKKQVEYDYKSGASILSYERVWRSDHGKFFDIKSSSIISSLPGAGNNKKLAECFGAYYEAIDGAVNFHCFPILATSGLPETQFFDLDGNQYLYGESNSAAALVPPSDVGHLVSRYFGVDGAVSHAIQKENNVLEQFSSDGLLKSKRWSDGRFINYTYSTSTTPLSIAPRAGMLMDVTNHEGRRLSFSYETFGQLKTLTDPAGGITRYAYDEASGNCPVNSRGVKCFRLTSVTYPDGKVRRYHYNELSHLDPTLDLNKAFLTGITDENGQRLSNYKYDAQERVNSSGWGGFDYQLSYNNPFDSMTEVTDPLGTQRVTRYQEILGRKRPVSQSQPGGSGCAAASSAIAYDANANKVSEDDFTGKRVCYAHDLSRNLIAARIDGLDGGVDCSTVTPLNAALPAGSRKTSSQWHPDWRLESRIAEPGRITTLVYNGRPDPTAGNAVASCAPAGAVLPDGKPIAVLCKKVEQATTDANGAAGFAATSQAGVAARVWKWTYNNVGQVLTEDGPRTDVSDITTYTYHAATAFTGVDPNAVGVTVGDLKSVTNAANKTTQYTKYNKHGQLLESSDPNGVLTTYTYDLRQRLLSATTGGQKTSYTYDAVGQLKRITRPDTSWVGYDYDPAHRLTAVYDNLSNRIDYTLDNAGNRVAENVKDPGGVLKRQLARSIDALGRVQQTTGLE